MDILTAYNGQQCLEQVHRSSALDVVILDLIMPEMDGLEVCAALQQMGPTHFIPIIVLTAKDNMDTRLTAMRLGVSEFLVKPVRVEDLVSRIRSQVEAVGKIRASEQAVANLKVKPKK
jgi:PleD family two-component response regulator